MPITVMDQAPSTANLIHDDAELMWDLVAKAGLTGGRGASSGHTRGRG